MTSAVAASFSSFGDIKPSQQFMGGRSSGFGPSSLSSSAGIAREKEELLALLEDIPQMHQSIHPSYTLIPWAYKLYLAVDRSEPSEMAKAYGVLSNSNDSAATGSKEEEQGCPHLDDTALPPSLSLAERRAIYQMVHSVLALSEIMDQLLEEGMFYHKNKDLYHHEQLVRLMAYNFLENKCTVKPPTLEGTSPEDLGLNDNIVKVAECLWKSRVKLSGAFAKQRVQRGVVGLAGLLTGPKKQSMTLIQSLTHHVRVVVRDSQPEECMAALYKQMRMKNFFRAGTEDQLAVLSKADPRYSQAFSSCVHCEDHFVAFAPGVHVEGLEAVQEGKLVPQDLPSLTALKRVKREMSATCTPEYDVLLTHVCSGTEAFHLAALLAPKGGRVFACGVSEEQMEKLVKQKEELRADSIHNYTASALDLAFLPTPFELCEPEDDQFDKVKLILCNPPCSLASVACPVDYIMQEGDHLAVTMLTPDRGSASEGYKYQSRQRKTLEHALTFPKCSRYVYFVRSHLQCETVDVVEAALKDTNKQEKEASSAMSSHGKKKGVSGKSATMSHFEQLSSQFMSFISNEQEKECGITYGYFLSFVSKKVFTPPAPKTVIQRAIDKGILTPFEAVDFTTSSNMKIHKPKKYKHNYLKPTYASEARSQQLKERNELEVWMSGGR